MSKIIDLHTHSNCSDGTLTPEELMELAAKSGISTIALTDHDTTAGIPEAAAAANNLGIRLIPGIEFSTSACDTEIHIVGLDINPENLHFSEQLRIFRDRRSGRNKRIIDLMRADGYQLSEEILADRYGDAVITRAHFARFLMEEGAAGSVKEAFDLYLGPDCKYYVPREKIPSEEAVALIAETGGIPVLAHPFQYNLDMNTLTGLVRRLKDFGLVGIEAFYSTHSKWQTGEVLALCSRLGLVPSGGSDFHGANKPQISLGTGFGNLHIPENVWDNLRSGKK